MKFETLVDSLISETTRISLGYFAPELVVCATILLLLFVRLFSADKWLPPFWVALAGSFVAFLISLQQFGDVRAIPGLSEEYFTGLLIYDQFTVYFRLLLLLFLTLVVALTVISGIPDNEDAPDFYTLLLGSTVGMLLMAGSNNLLMLFLSVEMTSVPSYVMVGFLKGRRDSSEAALKYVVYGAGAAGVMLYGTSLIAGTLGTVQFPEMTTQVGALLAGAEPGLSDPAVRTLALGALMVLVGLFFKLSVVPFHFWCPDAFHGASAEVAGFLSVASKAGAFALLVRFCLALVGDTTGALAEIGLPLGIGLGVIAAVTATFGNLAAYSQRNAKRLLAYSTIAHAGYMLMAVSAMVVILSAPAEVRGAFGEAGVDGSAVQAVHGLLYYLFVYLFMNLGAFAIVALIRNDIYSEEIEDYAGLGAQAALPCVCMAICLFSLVGFPPFGGFVGKFFVFAPVLDAAKVHWSMWFVLVVGGLNTVFSLFYYVRIPKAMFLESRPEGARPIDSVATPSPRMYVLLITIPIVFLGVMIRGLSETAQSAASVLF